MTDETVMTYEKVKIGLVSVSDRASQGVYTDLGLPALKDWLSKAVKNPLEFVEHLIPDERQQIEGALKALADTEQCALILTTGGTGPAPRDITPDATLAVGDREMPGFGEQMRQISLHYVPTAILSRQTAVIRGAALIVNLPGQPKSIAETLGGVRGADGQVIVHGLFSAIPYCIDILQGPRIEVNETVTQAFRPKKK